MQLPRLVTAAALAMLLAALLPASVLADAVRRTVGDYELTVRYASEPPYLEEGNALILEVTDLRTGQPVTGLEQTLTVEGAVVVEETRSVSQVPLRAVPDQPGRYEGVFVPPAIGQYSFRVAGAINGVPVDETFRSGEGGLPDVVERQGLDYGAPGSLLALALLIAYVVGVGIILMVGRRRRRSGTPHAAG